ncbi:hypothetical protein SLU01_19810 [Sporosarcina luteola]|uniref:Uncharacterized protein n=1 Tax=Sporosarcina luteola TaxID=582850 RepID=A0A511Z893_9BACL|nr:hypothetical protein SLU01_19810 [Sporosarcina luteola]
MIRGYQSEEQKSRINLGDAYGSELPPQDIYLNNQVLYLKIGVAKTVFLFNQRGRLVELEGIIANALNK